jgi:dTDP-4-dehydrorhamnose reductase
MSNILIFGSTGLLGSNFMLKNNLNHNIYGFQNKRKIKFKNIQTTHFNLNIKNLKFFLEKKKIEFIINFSAMTSIDNCEKNKKQAYIPNVKNVEIICKAIKDTNIKLIHISTDHIFKNKNKKFDEKSARKSWNYYSYTKIMAENIIIRSLKRYIILRTSFFGWGTNYRRSFSDNILNDIDKNNKRHYWKDVFFNPVYVGFLATLILKFVKNKKLNGIFNISTNKKISKFLFARKIANKFNKSSKLILSNKINYKSVVKRPKNMVLSNSLIKKIFPEMSKKFSLDYQINMMKKDKKIKLELLNL